MSTWTRGADEVFRIMDMEMMLTYNAVERMLKVGNHYLRKPIPDLCSRASSPPGQRSVHNGGGTESRLIRTDRVNAYRCKTRYSSMIGDELQHGSTRNLYSHT